jgi:hypothetical protein
LGMIEKAAALAEAILMNLRLESPDELFFLFRFMCSRIKSHA